MGTRPKAQKGLQVVRLLHIALVAPGVERAVGEHVEEVRRHHADLLDDEQPQVAPNLLQAGPDIGRRHHLSVAMLPDAHLRRFVTRGRRVVLGGDVLGLGPLGANDLRDDLRGERRNRKSMAGSTICWTIAVLPEPPWPISNIWKVRRRSHGTSRSSSSHVALQASANFARNSVWSRFKVRGIRFPVVGSISPSRTAVRGAPRNRSGGAKRRWARSTHAARSRTAKLARSNVLADPKDNRGARLLGARSCSGPAAATRLLTSRTSAAPPPARSACPVPSETTLRSVSGSVCVTRAARRSAPS